MNQAMNTGNQLSIRVAGAHPNHHLWNNRGTWWCHFTVHRPDSTKQRLRRSLGTRHLQEAREIRDFLFAVLPGSSASACAPGPND